MVAGYGDELFALFFDLRKEKIIKNRPFEKS